MLCNGEYLLSKVATEFNLKYELKLVIGLTGVKLDMQRASLRKCPNKGGGYSRVFSCRSPRHFIRTGYKKYMNRRYFLLQSMDLEIDMSHSMVTVAVTEAVTGLRCRQRFRSSRHYYSQPSRGVKYENEVSCLFQFNS